jgi:tetratricopeptide (TPR) repeat protein
MTCEDVVRDEIVEKYLHERLGEEVRDAFEQHYFECASCFGVLQTYRDLQAELAQTMSDVVPAAPRRSWIWQWAWVPATAAVLVAVSLTVWQLPLTDRGDTIETAQPSVGSGVGPQPTAPSTPAVSLADLARVEPPRYTPGRLRGAADEATARYLEAMRHYQSGDYPAAISGLSTAAKLDPDAPHVMFFLGISRLMAGQPDAAIDALLRTVSLGDSPYIDETPFFLAKAYLQKGIIDEARTQLRGTVQRRGAREAEARQLLLQLETFKTP